jgi:heterogeneous nuclear rnp K-like protein 2
MRVHCSEEPGQREGGGGSKASAARHAFNVLKTRSPPGVIIGRGGATIATIRTESVVKAGVSKVVPGVADRILSIGGSVDGVAKVRSRLPLRACAC